MRATRRALLAAAVAATAGCTGIRSNTADTETENQTATPAELTETPAESKTDGEHAPVHWSQELPHDELGMLSLGGGPVTPAIYVGSAASDDESADADHALHAFSMQEGREMWRTDVPNPVRTAPRYVRTEEVPRVIFATGRESLHGEGSEIRAVDHSSGEHAWRFDIDDRRFLYPIVTNEETVFVGRRDDQFAESGEYVYALDGTDGDERWRAETGDVSRNGNARRRDNLLVKTLDHVSALDMESGDERWRAEADTVGYDNRGKQVFVRTDDTVRALALADGSERWRREFDFDVSTITTPREAMDETVFVGDSNGRLLALSSLDGETRWTLSVDGDGFRPSVERTSELLYVGGAGVHAVEPVSGERQWSFTPDVKERVDVDASTAVFASTDRQLWALNPESGEARWEFAPGGQFAGMASAGESAFVAVDGTAYALDGSESS